MMSICGHDDEGHRPAQMEPDEDQRKWTRKGGGPKRFAQTLISGLL
jgi:hypothetical protein